MAKGKSSPRNKAERTPTKQAKSRRTKPPKSGKTSRVSAGSSGTSKPAARRPAVRPYELPPPAPVRGLLPVPPEVAKIVAREVKRLPMTAEAKQRLIDSLSLQYYFGGHEVVYRETPLGVEVLAAGMDDVTRLYKELPDSQQRGMVLGCPPPW